MSPNGPVVAMPGQDVNIAALKFLAEQLHAGFVCGGLDGRGQLTLQLGEFSNLPTERVTGRFAPCGPGHLFMTVGLTIPGSAWL